VRLAKITLAKKEHEQQAKAAADKAHAASVAAEKLNNEIKAKKAAEAKKQATFEKAEHQRLAKI
jgi:hypothetical protein